jgi:hypothetical protein
VDRLQAESLDEVIRQALTNARRPDGWNPLVILTDSLRQFNPRPAFRASRESRAVVETSPTFALTPELVDRIAERMIRAVRNGESPETALSVLTLIHRPEARDAAAHALIHRAGLSEQALLEALFVLAQHAQAELSPDARAGAHGTGGHRRR